MAKQMRTKLFQKQNHVLDREIYDERYPVRKHNIKNPQLTHLQYSNDKTKIQKRSALLIPNFDKQRQFLKVQRFGRTSATGTDFHASHQALSGGENSDYNESPTNNLFDSSRTKFVKTSLDTKTNPMNLDYSKVLHGMNFHKKR